MPRKKDAKRKDPKKTPWWRKPVVIANIVFVVAIVGIAFHFDDDENLVQVLTHIDLWWLLLAILFQIITYFCFAGLMVATLRIFKKKVKLHTVAGLSVAKLFLDQAIPTLGVGGSLMVMQGLAKRNATRGEAMAATVTEVISRWFAYFFFFGIALVLLWVFSHVTKSVKYIALFFTILFVIIISLLVYMVQSARHKKLPKWLNKVNFLKPALDSLSEVPHKALYSWELWAVSFVLQSLIFVLDAATLWICLLAVGNHASPITAFISFMLASAIATLSLIPGGLGFFEGTAIGVLASLGVSLEAGVAATILLRGLTYWIPMLPGYFLFRRELARQEELSHRATH